MMIRMLGAGGSVGALGRNPFDPRAWLRAGSLALILVPFACSDRPDVPAGTREVSVRDSAGIEIVEVPGEVIGELPIWRISDEPTLSIGAVEGEEPYLFSYLQDAATLGSGEIAALDARAREIRLFDADGQFLRTLATAGEGPGEMSGFVMQIRARDAGGIAFLDPNLFRFNAIAATGEVLAADRADAIPCAIAERGPGPADCRAWAIFRDGTILFSQTAPTQVEGPGVTGRLERQPRYFALAGPGTATPFESVRIVPIDRIVAPVPETGALRILATEALFGAGEVAAVGPSELVVGHQGSGEIRIRDESGKLVRMLRIEADRAPVTDALLDEIRRSQDPETAGDFALDAYLATFAPLELVPLFGTLMVDEARRLWVSDYVLPPRFRGATRWWWTVFGPNGRPLARIETGDPAEIFEIGADHVLMRELDEVEVHYLRRYGIERGG